MRWPLLAFLAAGCATTAASGDLPTPRQVASAIVVDQICLDLDGLTNCNPPPRRAILRRLRCLPAEDPDHPARVLCRYSGQLEAPTGSRRPIPHDCAYLVPTPDGGWRIDSFPDADMCGARRREP